MNIFRHHDGIMAPAVDLPAYPENLSPGGSTTPRRRELLAPRNKLKRHLAGPSDQCRAVHLREAPSIESEVRGTVLQPWKGKWSPRGPYPSQTFSATSTTYSTYSLYYTSFMHHDYLRYIVSPRQTNDWMSQSDRVALGQSRGAQTCRFAD